MKKSRLAIGLVICFVFMSLITVLSVTWQRMQVEDKNNMTEIVLDYNQFKLTAEQSDNELLWWLKNLKELGATSIGVSEVTLWDYLEEYNIFYDIAGNIKNTYAWEKSLPAVVAARVAKASEYDMLIQIDKEEHYNFIVDKLKVYDKVRWEGVKAEGYSFILIAQEKSDMLNAVFGGYINDLKKQWSLKETKGTQALNLVMGFDPNVINYIKQSGLALVLRPVNNYKHPEEAYKIYLSELGKYEGVRNLLLFSGAQVVGYGEDYESSIITELIDKKGMNIGLVEPDDQRLYIKTEGLEEVIEDIAGDRLVRVFTVWPYIQTRYKYYNYDGPEEITNSLYRAITERNIGVIYLTPIKEDDFTYLTDFTEYEKMFNDLKIRIAAHGYSLGEHSTFEAFSTPLWVKILLSMQVLIFGLILFNVGVFKLRFIVNAVFAAILSLGTIASYFVAPNLSVKLFALGAAIIFSSLSVTLYIKRYLDKGRRPVIKNPILVSVVSLVETIAISLLGALYIGSIMADVKYLLELEIFTGVKASVILPIFVVLLVVVIHNIDNKEAYSVKALLTYLYKKAKAIMNTDIKIKYMVILAFVGLVGYVYIARTGHASSIINPEWEINIRNFLEDILIARPRTKEVFISFPLTVLATYLYLQFKDGKVKISERIFVLAAAMFAIVGQSSITNTFSHIRTPLYMSLYRTGYAALLGAIIGLMFIAAANAAAKLYKSKVKA